MRERVEWAVEHRHGVSAGLGHNAWSPLLLPVQVHHGKYNHTHTGGQIKANLFGRPIRPKRLAVNSGGGGGGGRGTRCLGAGSCRSRSAARRSTRWSGWTHSAGWGPWTSRPGEPSRTSSPTGAQTLEVEVVERERETYVL